LLEKLLDIQHLYLYLLLKSYLTLFQNQ
jgi:hypothetical protein